MKSAHSLQVLRMALGLLAVAFTAYKLGWAAGAPLGIVVGILVARMADEATKSRFRGGLVIALRDARLRDHAGSTFRSFAIRNATMYFAPMVVVSLIALQELRATGSILGTLLSCAWMLVSSSFFAYIFVYNEASRMAAESNADP